MVSFLLPLPVRSKMHQGGQNEHLRFGVSSMQGWRRHMEDAYSAKLDVGANTGDWSFFAVFDGHGGAHVSQYCATHFLDFLLSTDAMKKALGCSQFNASTASTVSFDNCTVPYDEHTQTQLVCSALRTAFLEFDEHMFLERRLGGPSNHLLNVGSTAVVVLLSKSHIYFAHVGDSRGLLIRKGNVYHATTDHKAYLQKEYDRIYAAGGFVSGGRVNAALAMSRAMGNYQHKSNWQLDPWDQCVSAEPDVTVIKRSIDDELVVLASDGVFDVLSSNDLYETIFTEMLLIDDLQTVCDNVLETCFNMKSKDNMTVMIVSIGEAGGTSSMGLSSLQNPQVERKRHAAGISNDQMKRVKLSGPIIDDDEGFIAHKAVACSGDSDFNILSIIEHKLHADDDIPCVSNENARVYSHCVITYEVEDQSESLDDNVAEVDAAEAVDEAAQLEEKLLHTINLIVAAVSSVHDKKESRAKERQTENKIHVADIKTVSVSCKRHLSKSLRVLTKVDTISTTCDVAQGFEAFCTEPTKNDVLSHSDLAVFGASLLAWFSLDE